MKTKEVNRALAEGKVVDLTTMAEAESVATEIPTVVATAVGTPKRKRQEQDGSGAAGGGEDADAADSTNLQSPVLVAAQQQQPHQSASKGKSCFVTRFSIVIIMTHSCFHMC